MLLPLAVSFQYCEEYRFGYHIIDCPDDAHNVYKYEDEYYYLMSNGTLARKADGEYVGVADDVESAMYYNNGLVLLK